jgi:replicative DNA helicase
MAQAAYDGTLSTEELCDQIERSALRVRPGHAGRTLHLSESVRQYSAQLERRYERRGELLGIPTGFPDLDRMLDGLQRSDLIIVAARPGLGKTSLLLNLALNAARRFHQHVAIFSLEMSHLQLTERLTAQLSGLDSQQLRSGQLGEEDWAAYNSASNALSELAIVIDDTPGLTPGQLAASARRLHARQPLDLIVVDYLQLIAGGSRPENRNQEIAQISRELKNLARELDVPVLVASQLSRAVEQRADKRPMLSDLRDSGAIEQDGDVILFIYREGVYDETCETPNLTELIIAKQRKGPTGMVELFWQPHLTQFCSATRRTVML